MARATTRHRLRLALLALMSGVVAGMALYRSSRLKASEAAFESRYGHLGSSPPV